MILPVALRTGGGAGRFVFRTAASANTSPTCTSPPTGPSPAPRIVTFARSVFPATSSAVPASPKSRSSISPAVRPTCSGARTAWARTSGDDSPVNPSYCRDSRWNLPSRYSTRRKCVFAPVRSRGASSAVNPLSSNCCQSGSHLSRGQAARSARSITSTAPSGPRPVWRAATTSRLTRSRNSGVTSGCGFAASTTRHWYGCFTSGSSWARAGDAADRATTTAASERRNMRDPQVPAGRGRCA